MTKRVRFLVLSVVFALCAGLMLATGATSSAAMYPEFDGKWSLSLTNVSGGATVYEIFIADGKVNTVYNTATGQSENLMEGAVSMPGFLYINLLNKDLIDSIALPGNWNAEKTFFSGQYTLSTYSNPSTGTALSSSQGSFTMKSLAGSTGPVPTATPYVPEPYTPYPYTPGTTPPANYTPYPTTGYPTPDYTPYPTPTSTNPFVTPTTPTDTSNQPIQIRAMMNNQPTSVVNLGDNFSVDVMVQLPSGSSGGITQGTPVDPYVSIYSLNMGWEVYLVMDQFENINISDIKAPILSNWSASTFDWSTLTNVVVPNESIYVGSYELRGWIVPTGQDIYGVNPSIYTLTIQGSNASSGGTPTPNYPPTPPPPDNTPYYPTPTDYTPNYTPTPGTTPQYTPPANYTPYYPTNDTPKPTIQ